MGSLKEVDYNKLKPYYKKVLDNEITTKDICKEFNLRLPCVVKYFSKYLVELQWELKGKPNTIKAVFNLPDGIQTYNGHNRLINELCGEYSEELHERIKKLSDENTKWSGF